MNVVELKRALTTLRVGGMAESLEPRLFEAQSEKLAPLRHGEAAGLRWRQVVTGLEPLGRLVVLTSYDLGDTKTGAERWMPLHPVLAAMLAEWRMRGWAGQQGRAPGPDELVVPHPKPTNRGRRVAFGGMRSDHDSYKRLRIDLDALGLRRRRFHDLRR